MSEPAKIDGLAMSGFALNAEQLLKQYARLTRENFIPTKRDRQADVAALRAAAAKLDALLDLDEAEVDAVVEDFRQSRRAKKKA
jgi:hypothetical protein